MNEHEKRADEEANFASAKVSDLCRLFGFGYMALSYSVVIANTPVPREIIANHGILLLLLGLSGALVALFDFAQYFFSYIQARSARDNVDGSYQPEPEWWSTKIRDTSYKLKQFTCLVGAVFLVLFTYQAFAIAVAGQEVSS